MKISSSAFQEGGTIPEKFSKDGQNVNPELRIEGVPAEAKSLALIVDDPDAPVGLFTHWLVWNIDPKTTEIAESTVPKGAIQGTNDFPGSGYDGPQPPSGLTWRDSHASRRTTTLSPWVGAFGNFARGGT